MIFFVSFSSGFKRIIFVEGTHMSQFEKLNTLADPTWCIHKQEISKQRKNKSRFLLLITLFLGIPKFLWQYLITFPAQHLGGHGWLRLRLPAYSGVLEDFYRRMPSVQLGQGDMTWSHDSKIDTPNEEWQKPSCLGYIIITAIWELQKTIIRIPSLKVTGSLSWLKWCWTLGAERFFYWDWTDL